MVGVFRDYHNINTKAAAWIGSVKVFIENVSLKQGIYTSEVFAFCSLTS